MTDSRNHPPDSALTPGRTTTMTRVVSGADTAVSVGSGSLPVLGTPVLLAWCEAATCAAVAPDLVDGRTSVGTTVRLEHLAASAVGDDIRLDARLVTVDGRSLQFEVEARDNAGILVGRAEIGRVIVDEKRFLGRLADRR